MAEQEQSPVAWTYELARAKLHEGGYTDWGPTSVAFLKPCVPEGSIRNLTPLYATPNPDAVNADKALCVADEMVRFEATYPHVGAAKHRYGEVIAGRMRYAEPETDKMFSAWFSARALTTPTPDKALMPEAAQIVEWLRGQAAIYNDQNPDFAALPEWTLAQKWANAIERGEYRTTPVEEPEKGATGPRVVRWRKASVALGAWMSAALDDPAVCDAMKADIREWFSAGEPFEGMALAATNAGQVEALRAWITYDEGKWADNTTGIIEAYGQAIAATRAALKANGDAS
jgi:hypothetical protein